MAKAINWPVQYRDHIINEPSSQPYIAVRLGRLYYDNQFWVPEEVVDIRVNSLRVRRGKVLGELRCTTPGELTEDDFALLKPGIQDLESLLNFLRQTYGQSVNEDTVITVVRYSNFPVDPDLMEHPTR